MAFVNKKKSVLSVVRFIWNNLVNAWEVWDKADETFKGLSNTAGEIRQAAEDEYKNLSADYQDAESYVKEGISDAKDVWADLKKAF